MSIERSVVGPIMSRIGETDNTVYLAAITADDKAGTSAAQTGDAPAEIEARPATAGIAVEIVVGALK